MRGIYGTKFVETEALLAVANKDWGTLDRLFEDMLPGELDRLPRDAQELADRCESRAHTKRQEANR